MADLTPAVTVYAAPDVDREQLARLIDAMARLNGVLVAIELHDSMPNARRDLESPDEIQVSTQPSNARSET